MLWKHKNWIGYGVYAVLFVGVMLYYRFPAEAFGNYVRAKVSEASPDITLTFKKITPSFPLGLALRDMQIFHRGRQTPPVFSAQRFVVVPKIGSFFGKTPLFRFRAHSYGGDIRGLFQFDRMDLSGPFRATADLKGLHLEKYRRFHGLVHRQISGMLNGKVSYRYRGGGWDNGSGEADLNVSGGEVGLQQPILGLRALKLDQTSISAALEEKRIHIRQLVFAGPAVEGGLTGDISIGKRFFSSGLNLKGTLEPRKDGLNEKDGAGLLHMLKQRLSGLKRGFVIRGTFSSPVFKFM